MTRRWYSRYDWKYFRSLVYMLQASEYDLREYFSWYGRIGDFRFVEKRSQLRITAKTRLLLGSLWIMATLGLVVNSILLIKFVGTNNLLWLILLVSFDLILPTILAYLVVIPLWLGQILIQKPREYFIIKKARDKIANINAIKIAIAGSYGKTTFKENLKTVLGQSKEVAATIGNQNTPIGISHFVEKLSGDEEILIFELGEYYPGDITKLCRLVSPDIGVITGVNEAHLEKFKSLEKSVDTIFELADFVQADKLYINAENDLAESRVKKENHQYSKEGIDSWKIKNIKPTIKGTKFEVLKEGKKIDIYTKLLGAHQVGPLAAAIAIAHKLGLNLREIREGISKIEPFEHRMQPSYKSDGSIWIDDTYNGNPDGVKATIEFLGHLKKYQIVYVTPGLVEMGKSSQQIHLAIGEQLAKVADKVILIKNSVTPWIEKGLKNNGYDGEVIWFDDAIRCYNTLPSLIKSGDLIVLQNDWPDNYT